MLLLPLGHTGVEQRGLSRVGRKVGAGCREGCYGIEGAREHFGLLTAPRMQPEGGRRQDRELG